MRFRSGKTRLVQSVFDSVAASNGYILTKKFEENSTNQLSLVLSAFNDLCTQVATGYYSAEGGSIRIWNRLLAELGSNFHLLLRILPNAIRLAPSPAALFSLNDEIDAVGDVNFFSLCDMIKRFMRAISVTARPVMLFLDDCHWSDSVSLGLIHTVLSDEKGESCLFFVGSYRDNEVEDNHILYGLYGWLSAFDVAMNTIRLGSMSEEDVLSLVSDSLGILPRFCQPLVQVVYRKTGGNPFFVQMFLRSLGEKVNLCFIRSIILDNLMNIILCS